jgi:hypothetical protein
LIASRRIRVPLTDLLDVRTVISVDEHHSFTARGWRRLFRVVTGFSPRYARSSSHERDPEDSGTGLAVRENAH